MTDNDRNMRSFTIKTNGNAVVSWAFQSFDVFSRPLSLFGQSQNVGNFVGWCVCAQCMYSCLCGYWLSFLIIKQSPLYNTVTSYKSHQNTKCDIHSDWKGREREQPKRRNRCLQILLCFFCWWTMTARMMANFRAWRILFVALVFFFSHSQPIITFGPWVRIYSHEIELFPSLSFSISHCECTHLSLSLVTLCFCFCANLHTKFGHKPFIVCVCMIV